jgi:hypothetical protein
MLQLDPFVAVTMVLSLDLHAYRALLLYTYNLHWSRQYDSVIAMLYTVMLTQCCYYTILLHYAAHTTYTLFYRC